jgi:hypothetical protein
VWHETKKSPDILGDEICAPLFIMVFSLNNREMPPGKGMSVLMIFGLCIRGSDVGSNRQNGYKFFIRRGSGVKK